jgi:hypothetical protein
MDRISIAFYLYRVINVRENKRYLWFLCIGYPQLSIVLLTSKFQTAVSSIKTVRSPLDLAGNRHHSNVLVRSVCGRVNGVCHDLRAHHRGVKFNVNLGLILLQPTSTTIFKSHKTP